MNLVNMTPHQVTILDNSGSIVRIIMPSGKTIRLASETLTCGEIDGIPLSKTTYGEPEGLPEKNEGTMYIVSQLVKNTITERDDLLVPANVMRDKTGTIIGCGSLGI